jgi:hypothetical protein
MLSEARTGSASTENKKVSIATTLIDPEQRGGRNDMVIDERGLTVVMFYKSVRSGQVI